MRTFFTRILSFKIMGLLLVVFNSGCSAIIYDLPRTASRLADGPLTLNAQTISINSKSGQTFQVVASGGLTPYTYSVESGSGTISSSGLFTAGTSSGAAVIRVVDHLGNTAGINVNNYYVPVNGSVQTTVVDSSGNQYIGGYFSASYPYSASKAIALNTDDGTPALEFDLQAGFDGYVEKVLVGPSGEVYAAGSFAKYRGTDVNNIAKLDRYGNLDTNFYPAAGTGGFDNVIYELALDATGSTLYVGGDFTAYRGVANSARYIAKLSTTDGSIDSTFHPVSAIGGFDSTVFALALNSTGTQLFVGGAFAQYRGVADSARTIAKLSTVNGSLDTTFHPNSAAGGFDTQVNDLALDSVNSKLYVGGNFTQYRGVADSAHYIAKLSTVNGAIDTTFHPVSAAGGFDYRIFSLALNSAGTTVYAGGEFWEYRGVADSAHGIAKLSTTNGAIDTTFQPVSATAGFDNRIHSVVLDSTENYLYAGGIFDNYRGVSYSANAVAKISATTGAPDTTFHPVTRTGGFNGSVYSLALDNFRSRLFVSGNFNAYRGVDSINNIAKLSGSDGSIDTTFYPSSSTGGFDAYVISLVLDSTEANLYVGGMFSSYRGVANSARKIAKLSTTTGAIDTVFHPVSATGGFDLYVYSLAIDSTDTYLYVGGTFSTYRGVANSAYGIAKIETGDGDIDTTFHPVSAAGGFNSVVDTVVLDPANAFLYVGGFFTAYRGVADSARRIAKLATGNGAIDTVFHPISATGGFDSAVASLAIDSTGTDLYAGGYFTTYEGVADSANRIAKLNTGTGALDTTFHPNSATGGFNREVFSLILDPTDAALYVGGYFNTYRSVANSAKKIAKLSTSNGAIDTTFHPADSLSGFGVNTATRVITMALDASGNDLFVGGNFGFYEGSIFANFGKINATSGAANNP